MRMIKGQKGLSLVEVTIMLLVLMLLTSVLAPSIFDFVHDAQWVKVKEDCEAIGLSIGRFVRDNGPCMHLSGATASSATCTESNRVDVLVSDGADAAVTTPNEAIPHMTATNWNLTGGNGTDTLEHQLVLNTPGYQTPIDKFGASYYPVGPQFFLGWRGAYLAPPIGPDPWGTKYYVNSGFLSVATNNTGSDDGAANRWWDSDTFCLSAGPNQKIETRFHATNGYGTVRDRDDFVYVIQGSSR